MDVARFFHVSMDMPNVNVWALSEWVRAYDWRQGGPAFESCWRDFASELWQNSFTPLCQCISEETLKAVVPVCLV